MRVLDQWAVRLPAAVAIGALAPSLAIRLMRFALLGLMLPGPIWAQPTAGRFEQGLLWRIERTGSEPSHVFGTIHVSDHRIALTPEAVAQAIERSSIVATEIEFDPMSLRRASDRLRLAADRSLRDIIGNHEFTQASVILAEEGIEPRVLERLTPFGAIGYLTVRPKASVSTLDIRIVETARSLGIATTGLESVDEQFSAFDRVDEAAFVAELRAMVAEPAVFRGYMEALVARYRGEDIGALLAMVREHPPWTRGASGPQAAVGEHVIDRRNARMVARMIPLFSRGKAFIAVGAAHLGGASGVLAQLEQQGYSVTRVHLHGYVARSS